MYVVIGCPRCTAARVAEEGQKTTGCPRCGYRIPMGKARVFLRTDDQTAAIEAIGRVNEAVASEGLPDGPWVDIRAPIGSPEAVPRGRPRKDVIARARDLFERDGSFTPEALAEEAEAELEKVEKLLDGLARSGEIYSPRPGRFAFVER